MFRAFLATVPDDYGNLITTGAPVTSKDVWVAVLAWLIVFIFIIIIYLTIKFIISKKRNKNQPAIHNQEDNYSSTEKSKGKYCFLKFLLYFFECMSLLFTVAFGGASRPMVSTGQKPTKKEVNVATYGWLAVALLIVMIIAIIKICS